MIHLLITRVQHSTVQNNNINNQVTGGSITNNNQVTRVIQDSRPKIKDQPFKQNSKWTYTFNNTTTVERRSGKY